jgi:16S rRNA (uracil1498-N3)-methyltransferase
LKDNKHEFALFIFDLVRQNNTQEITLIDTGIIQRIISVLRLTQGDSLMLFDQQVRVQGKLGKCTKKSCTFLADTWTKNIQIKPDIIVLLPLLKRDAFESAIYSCTALGATTIQLVHTEKTRKWQGEKELDRLQRIVTAAAEQAKNFSFPIIKTPISIDSALERYKQVSNKLFAEPNGEMLLKALEQCNSKKEFLLLVGPEGDLTTAEKELITTKFVFCRLTQTILKSEQALALLLGTVRIAT